MRKCENCRYLASEGYEYPEYYCSAGISENDEHFNGEGCNYHWKTLKKKYDELQEDLSRCYDVPTCSDCLYYSKCKDIEKTKAKAYDFNLVCDDFCRASDYIERKSCSGCYYKEFNMVNKCRCCSRNKKMKDNYFKKEI